MSLTALAVTNAKRKSKPYKLFDGGGLYLLVKPTGGRYWRLNDRFGGLRALPRRRRRRPSRQPC